MAKIDEIKMLRLGQRDENLSRSLTFDCSDWLEQYPEASIHILFRRPGESAIVPMSTTLEGTTLTWLIHDYEVGKTGVGNAEFRAVDTAGLRRKSRIIPCSIEETLLGDDETVLYTQDQVDETLAHISEAVQAAQAAKASEEAAALSASEAGESAASAGTAADVAVSAKDAAQAAQTAAETAQHQAEAAQSGVHADAVAAEQAKVAAQAAQANAQGAASQASADRVAAETARSDAEAAAEHAEAVVEGIDQAGADQVAVVNAAGQAQVTAVNQAGTTQVGNVNAAGTTQVSAVQAKGTQVIASIPADYSALSSDVTDLKSTLYDKITYVGKGNTFAEYTYDGRLRPGHSYRVYVKLWDTTGITVTTGIMFRLGYTSNGTATYLHTVYGNDSSVLEEYYDVNIPDNAVNPMFAVGGRATGIAILGVENGELVLDPVLHSEVDPLKSGVTVLMLGNAPTKQKVVNKRVSSSSAYSVMQINVESGRRYRIDMSNIDALVGASLYLRVRKADNSGNAYIATRISGDIPANTKWTYYFNCTVTESVDVQIYRDCLTEDATFSVGVLCDDDRRDISTLMSDLPFVNEKVNMDVSRNLTGPDLNVLYPIPPLKDNDVITISAFNPANVNSYTQVYFYEEDGTSIKYWQFDSGYASAGRQITLNLDGKTAHFIKFVHDCGSPLMVERGTKTDFIPHYTTNYEKYLNSNSSFGEFELFLPEQAGIIRNNLATARMAKRLCFGHVSDNHSTVEPFICSIIDLSDAKFIVNTGDIVQDKYSDAYTNFPNMINAMTKPYYITLGNHDVYKAPSISDIFSKYFVPIIDHNGQTGLDKTYYSVDFTDEGIKCIFLDPYDAIADYSVSMETVIAGKMSATQINWFLDQLDSALSSHMHVCVFLHLSPEIVGEKELKFFDVNTTESRKVTYTFIPDVIDAFLDGGSVTFNYDGNSYTHTFASSGVFVGYFCGHMHCDCIGKLKTHNRQNAFSVTRPWQSSATNTIADGTYRHGSSKWGSCTFNYVTVDPTTRHVSVMRVLQQETKYGFKRDFVTMEY